MSKEGRETFERFIDLLEANPDLRQVRREQLIDDLRTALEVDDIEWSEIEEEVGNIPAAISQAITDINWKRR
jgi:hypothetical protein